MGGVDLRLCSSDDCPATAQTTDLFSISAEIVSEVRLILSVIVVIFRKCHINYCYFSNNVI